MSQEWAAWIGRGILSEDVATARLAAEYRACLGEHLFETGDGLPPGFHWGLAPATPPPSELGSDGSEARGLFLPPIPLMRRMWAGGRVETLAPIAVGARIRRQSKIADIQGRTGSSGALCFVSISHEIFADGVLAVRERQDLVFRDASATGKASPMAAAAPGGMRWTIEASPVLLFRFSAFTFNGHRIHYDEPYARAEGYGGLVVHGPLQAALMLNQAAAALGHVPRSFDYRCLAPLPGGTTFTVSTRIDAGLAASRVGRDDGVTTAEGQAPAPGT